MNFNKAIHILELPHHFTEEELRKSYYKKALRYHPDKNKEDDAEEKFKEINLAYHFLQKHKKIAIDIIPKSFQEMIKKCLSFIHLENKWKDIFIDTTLQSILLNYKKIPLNVFEALQKDRAIELYAFFMCAPRSIFHFRYHFI